MSLYDMIFLSTRRASERIVCGQIKMTSRMVSEGMRNRDNKTSRPSKECEMIGGIAVREWFSMGGVDKFTGVRRTSLTLSDASDLE